MTSWVSLAVLGVAISSLVVASIVSLTYGKDLGDGLVTVRLITERSLQADQLEQYFATLERRTQLLATDSLVVDAAKRFGETYETLTVPGTADDAAVASVEAYYRDEFVPSLFEAVGATVPWRELVPLTDSGIYLQDVYVTPWNDPADRRAVDDGGDGSEWTEAHQQFHPDFLALCDRFGFEDLYLVAPDGGAVVYSTAKGVEFATDLNAGPHSGTTLASLVRSVSNNPQRDTISVADLASYVPDLAQPVGFLASPIFDGDTLVGIIAIKIPVDEINRIMTLDGGWENQGFGETGETYLIGADGRMRSVARQYVEDPAGYLEAAEAAGSASASDLRAIAATDTTIIYQRVATPDTVEELRVANDELRQATSFTGDEVVFAIEPLDINGLDWLAVTSRSQAELNEPLDRFQRAVLIAVSLFVVAITFFTVSWSRNMFRPVREISERLRRVHEDEPAGAVEIPKRSPAEFKDLAANLDRMIEISTARQAELEAAVSERVDTVRSLLPSSIAARIEAGDPDVMDHVPNTTVAVLAIGGLGTLVHRPVEQSRELLDRIIDELDTLGAKHGVERAKLVGDAYYAGCGLNQWYLDHAPRTVAFAQEARDMLQRIDQDVNIELSIAAGIKSGAATVGLGGSTRLVYDLWGDTVDEALYLARSARPGQILVADTTRQMLPADEAVVRWGDQDRIPPVWEIEPLPTVREGSP
jgi:class 3 adenylate cyclase